MRQWKQVFINIINISWDWGVWHFFVFKTLSGKSGPIENSWKTKTVHMIVFQPCASKIVGISVEQQLIAESFSQPSSSRTKTTAFETKFSSIKKRWFLWNGVTSKSSKMCCWNRGKNWFRLQAAGLSHSISSKSLPGSCFCMWTLEMV